MRHAIGLLVAGVLTACAAASVQAQEQPKYRGFWIAFGAGGGWETWQWDFGTVGRGHSVYLRMGGTVSQHVLFGGEVLGWFNDSGGQSERVNVTAAALVYPFASGPWFLKGGWGVAQAGPADRQGVGVTLGSGFDFRLGGNFYVTPNVDLLVQFLERETNASLLFTMGATWH
ncbi:MAG: hypothetical protein JSW43_01450 [Gemmatimonadota bacterium]|nr:MAG: hypothetical protein JSW43_01450 [Gemmatimonadota bacterium]